MNPQTCRVFTEAHGDELITINLEDFNPAIHRVETDGPWADVTVEVKGKLPDDFPVRRR